MSILITGAAGFIGQALTAHLLAHTSHTLLLTDTFPPPYPETYAPRVTSRSANLTDPAAIRALLPPGTPLTGVYTLHGLMSSGSEANLEAGLAVNIDSHRLLLDHLRIYFAGTRVIFTSSTAVFGHLSELAVPRARAHDVVVSERTQPLPEGSYGMEKHAVEGLVLDYIRRGLLEGLVVRLPTVIVRPGAPSAAASSFASGVVRETARGVRNVVPVRRDLDLWVCSPGVVVANLVHALGVTRPEGLEDRVGTGRLVNLPGQTVQVQQILEAVEEVLGKDEVAKYVVEERDREVERICESWPARFDCSWAERLGFRRDVGLVENVRQYVEESRKG